MNGGEVDCSLNSEYPALVCVLYFVNTNECHSALLSPARTAAPR